MRAVLALEKTDFSKHSAVISYFRKEYIKTGVFDKSLSKTISEVFMIRTSSDYDDFYIVPKKNIYEQLENVEEFYKEIKNMYFYNYKIRTNIVLFEILKI